MYAIYKPEGISDEELLRWADNNNYVFKPVTIKFKNIGLSEYDVNLKPLIKSITKPQFTWLVSREQLPNSNRSIPKFNGQYWVPIVATFINEEGENAKKIFESQIDRQLDNSNSTFDIFLSVSLINDPSDNIAANWVIEKCRILKVVEEYETYKVYFVYKTASAYQPVDDESWL